MSRQAQADAKRAAARGGLPKRSAPTWYSQMSSSGTLNRCSGTPMARASNLRAKKPGDEGWQGFRSKAGLRKPTREASDFRINFINLTSGFGGFSFGRFAHSAMYWPGLNMTSWGRAKTMALLSTGFGLLSYSPGMGVLSPTWFWRGAAIGAAIGATYETGKHIKEEAERRWREFEKQFQWLKDYLHYVTVEPWDAAGLWKAFKNSWSMATYNRGYGGTLTNTFSPRSWIFRVGPVGF